MTKIFGLLKYLKAYKGSVFLNIFFNILYTLFSFASLGFVMPFFDILFNPERLVLDKPVFVASVEGLKSYLDYYISKIIVHYDNVEAGLIFIALLIIVSFLLKNAFRYAAQFFLANVRNGIVKDIRIRLNDKILSLPLSYFNKVKKGNLISTLTSDVTEVEHSILSILEVFVKEPIALITALVLLFSISTQLTLFVFLLLILIVLLIGTIGKSLKKSSFEGQEKVGFLTSLYDETISGMRVIKAFTAENYRRVQFNKESNIFFKIMNRVQRRRVLASPLTEFLSITIFSSIVWFGGKEVIEGDIQASTFIFYLLIFGSIIGPAKSFSSAYFNVQKGMGGLKRIDGVLKVESEIIEEKDAIAKESFDDKIAFKNVSFAYNNIDDKEVLKDVSFELKKGNVLAIVGPSGAGKTTIVDLIPRFYDVEKGEISIDGVNIKSLKKDSLRQKMGIVTQESILFNDSIANNIAFGIDASQEEIINAAKVANAHEFIAAMPNAYETQIGDRGQNLSGGQRQRLTIARAILKNPSILILDEATSALDSESEKLVQDALIKLMRNRTSIVIAHRLSTIQFADEIIVMEEGKIVENGNHISLMAKQGLYSKLVNLQAF
ncbi:MAG: ABC transporter ATP-binding protein [Chitinophagales bacterium]